MSRQLPLTEANLPEYLRQLGVLAPGDEVAVEAAGDGNINWVRRVRRAGSEAEGRSPRSWIVKQARPALERFPEYEAPTERIVIEHRWYETVAPWDTGGVCPDVLGFDEANRVLVLEDLGSAERLDARLGRGGDALAAVRPLAAFLGRVHAGTRDPALAARFANDGMRTLHGDHIFLLPLRDNDFPLEPAVAARAAALRADSALVESADAAYARYREPRGALVHGDVQAGNVLLSGSGPKLLDAEIAHVGDPAFDVGTLLAHVALPHVAAGRAEGASETLAALWECYAGAHGEAGCPAFADVARYAGLEMLRRTIGAARVPAIAEEPAALAVLECAAAWISRPPDEAARLS